MFDHLVQGKVMLGDMTPVCVFQINEDEMVGRVGLVCMKASPFHLPCAAQIFNVWTTSPHHQRRSFYMSSMPASFITSSFSDDCQI